MEHNNGTLNGTMLRTAMFPGEPVSAVNSTSWRNQSGLDQLSSLKALTLRVSLYLLPVIIVSGVIGNCISLVVLLKTYLRRLSVSVYLAALSTADTVFLLTLLVIWLEFIPVRALHRNGLCQITIYLSYCSSFMSVWCVVGFSVERCIAICYPLQRPIMCTPGRAKLVAMALGGISLTLYLPVFWSAGIQVVQGRYHLCTPMRRYESVVEVLMYVDTILTFIVPIIAIVTMNIIIMHQITQFSRRRQKAINVRSHGGSIPHSPHGMSSQIRITKSILLISSVYLLINLPSYVVRIRVLIRDFFKSDYDGDVNDYVSQQLSQFLYYLSYAINFFLYSVSSTKFREAFQRLWRKVIRNLRTWAVVNYDIIHWQRSNETAASAAVPMNDIPNMTNHWCPLISMFMVQCDLKIH